MQSTQLPALIPLAWAASGTKNAIPTTSQVGITDGAASLTTGFPPLTATPLAAGGVPPSQGDFNGAFNLITQLQVAQSAGIRIQYDATFAAAVGGYPLGAEVRTSNGKIWRSLVENNTTAPANGANWADSDALLTASPLFAAQRTSNGYQKFANGLIEQWGTATGSTATVNATFPIAFPNGLLGRVVSLQDKSSGSLLLPIYANTSLVSNTQIGASMNNYDTGAWTFGYRVIGW